MAGNRKHGFRRGSRAGRNGFMQPEKWFCEGCQKEHTARTEKTVIYITQKAYCNKQYFKLKAREA